MGIERMSEKNVGELELLKKEYEGLLESQENSAIKRIDDMKRVLEQKERDIELLEAEREIEEERWKVRVKCAQQETERMEEINEQFKAELVRGEQQI